MRRNSSSGRPIAIAVWQSVFYGSATRRHVAPTPTPMRIHVLYLCRKVHIGVLHMIPRIARTDAQDPSLGRTLAGTTLWAVWQAIRLPVFALLMILEPVVHFLLVAIALLSLLMAFFFEFSGAAPHFPFWGMLTFSAGCGLLLIAYEGMIRLFSR